MKKYLTSHLANINKKTIKLANECYRIRAKLWMLQRFYIMARKSNKTIPIWNRLCIELQSDCNRDCYFCPRYADRTGIRKDINGKHIRRYMPTSKVFDIIDQAEELGYTGFVQFHRLSEPFLDKRYLEVAYYAKQKGMRLEEDTNGDVLKNNPDLCSKVDGLLHTIHIGLYDYKNNIEKNKQISFWKKRFKKTKVTFSMAAEFPIIRVNSKLYLNEKKSINTKIKNYPCLWPMVGLAIRYDGEVSLCCEDDQCTFGLGNVFDSSIREIWWSKKHIEIINNLKSSGGRNLYHLCKNCNLRGIFCNKLDKIFS